ncbi:MAG TPA: transcriptional regulator [Candidatus Nanoarchaeia archaeon]|nr:transcriptional regulator [Candidatus Nanoarchaeia archaeon]
MSKDQAIGGAILAVCVIVAIGYALLVIFPAQVYGVFGTVTADTGNTIRLYAVLVPVFVAFVAILLIGAWIGWTMATTPPPKPIEEITTEMEEKKEDAADMPAAEAPASAAPEKKKK